MSLQDQKLGKEEVELNEEDLDVIAGGGVAGAKALEGDNFVAASCNVTNNC